MASGACEKRLFKKSPRILRAKLQLMHLEDDETSNGGRTL
jgi:hypothetical protein